ncbi:MAG: class D sortase [Anaerolineaceae bacterium]|nr:class D sortase [Anaerolineaceae bacterium]
MARKRSAEELSVEELRRLLVEKRRADRQARLDHYRRTGRAIIVEPQPTPVPLESLRSGEVSEVSKEEEPAARQKSVRRTGFDRFLLLIEFIAVIGFLFILYSGFGLLQSLNKEVASALTQPTLTPTALIRAVVLPSGHTPPNSPGGVQPNDAEIPVHLRPLVQSLANIPIPTPGPQQAVRIQVPALGVDAPVVQGDGWDQLKKGVGQQIGSPDPGSKGNIVLSAHNDVFGQIFQNLDKLKPGDQIILFTSQRTYTYVVHSSQIVEPTQLDVLAPTQNPVVTLISCYPYMVDNKRIVVVADLQDAPSS